MKFGMNVWSQEEKGVLKFLNIPKSGCRDIAVSKNFEKSPHL